MKILRFLLFPLSIIYGIILWLRNKLFDWGIFKSQKYITPIIAIGNLSTGGTGKTPHTEYLIHLFKEHYKMAVLSRGYGRNTSGYLKANNNHTASDIGDEPKQYFDKFDNITVAVSEKRVIGIEELLKTNKPDLILLDDAYQHRWVKADFTILLTDYNKPFYNDWLLPTGNLREGKLGKKRANCIIVTKCPTNLSEADKNSIIKKIKPTAEQEAFFTCFTYGSAKAVFNSNELPITSLKNTTALVVTGIASPAPLYKHLESIGVKVEKLKFADHHSFSNNDIQSILEKYKNIPSKKKIILTTEKDATRLKGFASSIEDVAIYYIPIEVEFLFNDENNFNALLKNFVST